MAENTKIEWADHTFNPWVGCTKVSPACDHCYAEGWAKRTGQAKLWQGERRRTSAANWQQPLKWNRRAEREGRRYRVFCASLADVFDNQVPEEWRSDLWRLILSTPHIDWLLLTKRPQNINKMMPAEVRGHPLEGPLRNLWLGTTVENQEEADRRIPLLLATPAAVRWVSAEPLLGPIDLHGIRLHPAVQISALRTSKVGMPGMPWPTDLGRIDWVIAGGESGPGARPMHPDWARSLRDQCAAAGVPFFMKQWGAWLPMGQVGADGNANCRDRGERPGEFHTWGGGEFSVRVGKAAAGRLLDGREHNGMPGQ